MTDIYAVRAWANEVCQQALTEGRNGNTILANKIGSNASLKKYFDMVHGTRTVKEDAFPAFYPVDFAEITRLYEAYLQDQAIVESVDKVAELKTSMDEKFAALEQQIANLVESLKPAASVEVEKPKAGKKAKKVEEEVVEGEDAAAEE